LVDREEHGTNLLADAVFLGSGPVVMRPLSRLKSYSYCSASRTFSLAARRAGMIAARI